MENLLPVCHYHHEAIHASLMKGPYKDNDGHTFYAETVHGERVRWRLWQEMAPELEAAALEVDKDIRAKVRVGKENALDLALLLVRFHDHSLYEIFDVSWDDYLYELDLAPAYANKLINAGRVLLGLPESEQVVARGVLHASTFSEAGSALARLSPEQRQEVYEFAEECTLRNDQVATIRDLADENVPAPPGTQKWSVYVPIEGGALMQVLAPTEEDAVRMVKARVGGYNVFRDKRNGNVPLIEFGDPTVFRE